MAGSKDVLLDCEDTAHRTFVYSCLSELGIEDLKWHIDSFVASLARQGGNRDDVVKRLNETELASWQNRCATHKVLLIAVIDADRDSMAVARGLIPTPTSYNDLFAVVIPKRNIQTWVELAADGASSSSPDDSTDYKRTATKSDTKAKAAARKLLTWYRGGVPTTVAANPVWQSFANQMRDLQSAIKAWKA